MSQFLYFMVAIGVLFAVTSGPTSSEKRNDCKGANGATGPKN